MQLENQVKRTGNFNILHSIMNSEDVTEASNEEETETTVNELIEATAEEIKNEPAQEVTEEPPKVEEETQPIAIAKATPRRRLECAARHQRNWQEALK